MSQRAGDETPSAVRAAARPGRVSDARLLATRYAEDEQFAEEFERELTALYEEHMRRLKRIASLAGIGTDAPELRFARGRFAASAATESSLDLEEVRKALKSASGDQQGLTRGKIAKQLGVESRAIALTHALKLLKDRGEVTQEGYRRSARYALVPEVRSLKRRG